MSFSFDRVNQANLDRFGRDATYRPSQKEPYAIKVIEVAAVYRETKSPGKVSRLWTMRSQFTSPPKRGDWVELQVQRIDDGAMVPGQFEVTAVDDDDSGDGTLNSGGVYLLVRRTQ